MYYQEIHKLKDMLEKANIEFTFRKVDGGRQIAFPDLHADVVQSKYSFGGKEGYLESLGLYTVGHYYTHEDEPNALGHLKAQDAFDMIVDAIYGTQELRERTK